MVYEMRVYEHVDGRAEAVRERFEREVAPRFPKHNVELVGVFVDVDTQRLTYLTRFPSEEARKKAWESFGSDPEWRAAKASSEANGPLIAKQISSVLTPAMSGLPIG